MEDVSLYINKTQEKLQTYDSFAEDLRKTIASFSEEFLGLLKEQNFALINGKLPEVAELCMKATDSLATIKALSWEIDSKIQELNSQECRVDKSSNYQQSVELKEKIFMLKALRCNAKKVQIVLSAQAKMMVTLDGDTKSFTSNYKALANII